MCLLIEPLTTVSFSTGLSRLLEYIHYSRCCNLYIPPFNSFTGNAYMRTPGHHCLIAHCRGRSTSYKASVLAQQGPRHAKARVMPNGELICCRRRSANKHHGPRCSCAHALIRTLALAVWRTVWSDVVPAEIRTGVGWFAPGMVRGPPPSWPF